MEEEDSTEEMEEEDSTEDMDKEKQLNLKLWMAALHGELEEVKDCINGGANKDYKHKSSSMTPLLCAASQGKLEVLQYLVLHGCDKQARDQSRNTALHLAAIKGYIQITKWLIDEAGMNLSDRSENGQTALHLAARNGHFEITKWLIENKGLDPMDKTLQGGKTALHVAAEGLKPKIVKWLIEKKEMDPMFKTTEGKTPLELAEKTASITSLDSSDMDASDVEENGIIPKRTRVIDFLEAVKEKKDKEKSSGILPENISTSKAKGQDEITMLSDKEFKDLLKTGSYKCYWNRVYLVGPFGVGKTTLAKLLVGDDAPEQRNSTDGIWIYLGRAGMNINERCWIVLKKGTIIDATIQSLIRSREQIEQNAAHSSSDAKLDAVESSEERTKSDGGNASKIISDIKKTNSKSTRTKETIRDKPSLHVTKEMSEEDILDLVRSVCSKGNYEMVIVPIDLWDFGGQKIYHMTHQLFISSRGTFVLIFNGSKGIHDEILDYAELPGCQSQRTSAVYLVHWVNSVLTYCKTFEGNEQYPKILLVATHKDKVIGDIEEHRRSLEASIEALFQNNGGKKHLQYQPLTFVDARNKEDGEIDTLKKQLVEVALNHPRCGELMPTKFVPLELQLAKKVVEKKKIITIEELNDMNNQNEKMSLDSEQLNLFLKINHALGKLIYFDETGLRDKVIIDPVFLVHVLRSIVTDEQFWPKGLLEIFKALKESGKLMKKDLFEIWKQDCFSYILEHKNYIVEMLVHLDIICRQKDEENGDEFFLVPCMISTKREDNMQIQLDKSIHLAYTFREEVVPPAILYRFIATFISIWKLQVRNDSSLMLFNDSADVSIDKEHNMRFDIKKNRFIITLSHREGQTSIVSTIASTAQECLTHAITNISNFYFSVTDDSPYTNKLPFTIEIGIVCGTDLCFIDHILSSKDKWSCPKHNTTHKCDIVSRWFADKLPRREGECYDSCPGIDNAWLDRKPDDKRLGRIADELTIEETEKMYQYLKGKKSEKSWKKIVSIQAEVFDININALHDWESSSRQGTCTFKKLQESMKAKEIDIHILCQILRDIQRHDLDLSPHAIAKLDLKPSSTDIKLLPNHIGKKTFHLGIELGLSVVEMHQIQSDYVKDLRGQTEEVLAKWRRHRQASYEVLVKTLYRLDVCSVLDLFTYEVGLKEQLEDKIRDNENSIIQQIQTNKILDHMMTHLVISADDRIQIDHHPRQDKKNKELVKMVLERVESSFTVFLEALQTSGYKELAKQLKCDDLGQIETLTTPENKGISEGTVPVCMVQLQKNYSDIVSNVMHAGIVDALISTDVLTNEDSEMINGCLGQHQKNRVLIDQILRKRENDFTEFLKALRVEHAELAEKIEKTEVTSKDISTIQSCYKKECKMKLS